MGEDLAATNVNRSHALAATNIAIFTFMLFFLYPRFENGRINPLLFQSTLVAMGVATFSLVFATLHYYRSSLGGRIVKTSGLCTPGEPIAFGFSVKHSSGSNGRVGDCVVFGGLTAFAGFLGIHPASKQKPKKLRRRSRFLDAVIGESGQVARNRRRASTSSCFSRRTPSLPHQDSRRFSRTFFCLEIVDFDKLSGGAPR